MIQPQKLAKGPAIAGALLLSGCGQRPALHDTYFVVTQPLKLVTSYLILTVALLAAWWVILKLSNPKPRRVFLVAMVGLATGLLLTSLPTLMLVTGIVWPSVIIILQLATLGSGLLGLVTLLTAALFVWRLLARLLDRLQ